MPSTNQADEETDTPRRHAHESERAEKVARKLVRDCIPTRIIPQVEAHRHRRAQERRRPVGRGDPKKTTRSIRLVPRRPAIGQGAAGRSSEGTGRPSGKPPLMPKPVENARKRVEEEEMS